jgi:hypothetical protein
MFIQVGNKRRKAFNQFNVYRRKLIGLDDPSWACFGSKNYYATGSYELWTAHILNEHVWPNFANSTYWRGEVCPFMNEAGIGAFGDELRDFVIRDLFIKANAPQFDGAVFLAELEETLTEFRSIFKGAVAGLRNPGKGLSSLRHLILHPEELWLWWRYFVMPAMMDAENLIELTKGVSRINRVQDGDSSNGLKEMLGSYEHYSPYFARWLPCEWKAEYKYGLGGAIDMFSRFDPHLWGTSDWDVIRAIWERIPWSFVADWFVNVGDWLASLREIQIDFAQSYATYAIEAKVFWTYPDWNDGGAKIRTEIFRQNRIVDLEPPSLPLVDRRWANCLRLIDSISLIVGTLRNVLTKRK